MIIAHISDSHIALPDKTGRLDDLALAVAEINALQPRADMVVHSGDIAHWATEDEYRAALNVMKKLDAPFYGIPGNRDKRATMGKVFQNHLGGSAAKPYFQYSVDQWPVKIVFLDTLDEESRLGSLCNERFEQLELMLKEHRPTVIFMHHPPFDVLASPDPFQFDSRQTVEKFTAIIEANPHVKAIYCGHSHRRDTGLVGRVPVSTIPALAIDLRWGDYPPSHAKRPAYEVYSV